MCILVSLPVIVSYIRKPRRALKVSDHDDDREDSPSSFLARRRSVIKSINNLHAPQRLYMPGSDTLLDAIDPILLADHPEDIELWLPSALPSASRNAQCIAGLPQLEFRLRFVQAANALHDIRRLRRLTRVLAISSRTHITSSQKTATRGRGPFQKTRAQLSEAVSTYRVARKAIANLSPNEEFGRWKGAFLELKDEDVRGPGLEDTKSSRSRFVQSWIWTTASKLSTSSDDPDLDAALRIEWCKAQERAKRYEEELELVIEEMRRTLVSFDLTAHKWEQRAVSPSLSALEATTATGIAAYAYKQADLHRKLIPAFLGDWYGILEGQPLAASWLKQYSRPSPKNLRNRLPCNVKLFHSAPSTPDVGDGEVPSSDGADSPNDDIIILSDAIYGT